MVNPVNQTCFGKVADGLDKASYTMYRNHVEVKESIKSAMMPRFAAAHTKIAEMMQSLYLIEIINAPYKALSVIDDVTQSVLDVANQVLSSIQTVSATVMNSGQSIVLAMQQVEAMRLRKTMNALDDVYNTLNDYQIVGDIISKTFSGEDGFPDPMSHLYDEMKQTYDDASWYFNQAYETLKNGGDDVLNFDKGINLITEVLEGNFSDQGSEFVGNATQLLEVVRQIKIQCAKAENYRDTMLTQMDAISQGIRRYRDEVKFDFGKAAGVEKIKEILDDLLSKMDKIPSKCKNNPDKYASMFSEAIIQSSKITELGSATSVSPIFDKNLLLNFETPDDLLLNDDIDDCYAHAMQLYSAMKKDLDNLFGKPVELSKCHGSSSTEPHPAPSTDVSFADFDAKISVMCEVSNKIADLSLAVLFGLPGAAVSEEGTKDASKDISLLVAQFGDLYNDSKSDFDRIQRSLEDFSMFPFADPNIISGIERFVTAGTQWMNGIEMLTSAQLWTMNAESFLQQTPIGYVFLTLRNCITSLVNLSIDSPADRQGYDDLIKAIRSIEGDVRKYLNDFTRSIESLMGFFSTIVRIIDEEIATFIELMLTLLTVCDFSQATAWENGLNSALDIWNDGISRIVASVPSRGAAPPVYKDQPAIRTIDAPLAVKAVGICKELANT